MCALHAVVHAGKWQGAIFLGGLTGTFQKEERPLEQASLRTGSAAFGRPQSMGVRVVQKTNRPQGGQSPRADHSRSLPVGMPQVGNTQGFTPAALAPGGDFQVIPG